MAPKQPTRDELRQLTPMVQFLMNGGRIPRTYLRDMRRPGVPELPLGIRKKGRGRLDDGSGMGLIHEADRTANEILNPRWEKDKVTSYWLGGMLMDTRKRTEEYGSGRQHYTRL